MHERRRATTTSPSGSESTTCPARAGSATSGRCTRMPVALTSSVSERPRVARRRARQRDREGERGARVAAPLAEPEVVGEGHGEVAAGAHAGRVAAQRPQVAVDLEVHQARCRAGRARASRGVRRADGEQGELVAGEADHAAAEHRRYRRPTSSVTWAPSCRIGSAICLRTASIYRVRRRRGMH